MNSHASLRQAIGYCQKIYQSSGKYRMPVIFLGRDSYGEYLDARSTHAWSQKFFLYAENGQQLLDELPAINGLGIHIESHLNPSRVVTIAQHFLNHGARIVFATDTISRETVFFTSEVSRAAA